MSFLTVQGLELRCFFWWGRGIICAY